jgi:hypothetical protein
MPFAQAGALVGDDRRHMGAEEGVDDENAGHHHQGGAKSAAGGFQQHDQAHDGDDQVDLGGVARAVGQIGIEPEQIGRTNAATNAITQS